MLTEPNLDVMIQRPEQGIHNKFELIILATKRARQITEGYPYLVKTKARKPVSVALQEIYQGKIRSAHSDAEGAEQSKAASLNAADSEAAALAESLGNQ